MTTPLLKWLGGKRTLAPVIRGLYRRAQAERAITRYIEPFLGGAAVYLHLRERELVQPGRTILADLNLQLIDAYRAVRASPESVHASLRRLPWADDWRAQYYRVRDDYNARAGDVYARAARLIWLNRHGFNGLYRVNRKGGYNVPIGRPRNSPTLPTLPTLTAFADALGTATLAHQGFAQTLSVAQRGDFAYADPPYVGGFTGYTAESFSDADQQRLVDAVRDARDRGAVVVVSNSVAAASLYDDADHVLRAMARTSIGGSGRASKPRPEIIAIYGLSAAPDAESLTRRHAT